MIQAAGALFLWLAGAAADETWPEFRGPGGAGHSSSVGLPKEWSETKNLVWKTPIPGKSWSSPVVWEKRIWMTTATPDGKQLSAVCVDRESGRVLLNLKLFDVEKPESETPNWNTYASPTPVVEADRVYLNFGSAGTACLATDKGKVLWSRSDLPCRHFRGAGSSPILYRDLLILPFDGYDFQYVVALDRKTGKTVWKTDRTHDFGTTDGDYKKCFSTPLAIEAGGRAQLVTVAAKAAVSLDPLTGKEIWSIKYPSHSTGTRPIFAHGLVYVTTGSNPADLIAVRPDGKGDVTATHVAWKITGGVGQKPSPLVVDDLLYVLSDMGVLLCLDAETGAKVWQQRINGGHSASPIHADGAIYISGENGTTVLIRPGREYRELSRGKLDGKFMATPAVAGKALFPRSETHLYRIESR
jgi:outer membrane protein assembly factor BamB